MKNLTLEHRRNISLAMRGRTPSNLGKEFSHKGYKHSAETRRRISDLQKGKRVGVAHHLWKGDFVGYRSLHNWVVLHRGTPDTCEHCYKVGLSGKKIQWANKSHQYKRELTDWIRLCVPCHRRYDKS